MNSQTNHLNRFPKRSTSRDRHLFWGLKPGRISCVLRPPGGPTQSLQGGEFPNVYPYPSAQAKQEMDQDYALTYVLSGQGQINLPSGSYDLTPGSFFQLSALPSKNWTLTYDEQFCESSINLDGITGKRMLELGLWNPNIVVGNIGFHPALIDEYLTFFEAIADVSIDAGTLLRAFFDIQKFVYALHYEDSPDEQFRQRASRRLADSKDWNRPITDIAAELGFSEVHFRRKFKQLTGLPPAQYRLKIRMDKAEELLPRHSVKEVAFRLGYSDPFVFSRQFKRASGTNPSQRRGTGRL